MKKSAEILGLPIISITEGAELGRSKTLLIDAKNELVAAITVEDDEWYRGVKLIPYESVTAIGEDAITIMQSENILSFDEAGAYENLLRDNIHVKGTKAITKAGRLEGTIAEIYVGDDGKIVKCDIESPDGTTLEVTLDKIAKFGKKVTVIDPDGEKKNLIVEKVAPVPVFEETPVEEVIHEPVEEVIEDAEDTAIDAVINEVEEEPPAAEELEAVMTPDPVEETPSDEDEFEPPQIEEAEPVEEADEEDEILPEGEEEIDEPILIPEAEDEVEAEAEDEIESEPEPEIEPEPEVESEPEPEPEPEPKPEPQKAVTQQAEALKAALKRAMEKGGANKNQQQQSPNKKQFADDRRRSMLLGKRATKTIKADTGAIIVEEGAEITEEVLQKAKLAGKFIDLSMNYAS